MKVINRTRLRIEENVPLAPLTTLRIGGPARFFVRAETEEVVAEALDFAAVNALPLFVLGGGSNVLISDKGFSGLVLQVALKGISPVTEPPSAAGGPDTVVLSAAAGEDWDKFVAYCVQNGLAGVECLSGIPGFVGGTPVQNVGAYGQEVSETIVSVRCFDRRKHRFAVLSNSDCGFAYRKSIFNTAERDRYIVLSVTYALTKSGNPKIAYKDLNERFTGQVPSLRETREAVLDIRRAKSMVIDPADPNSRSAGSFFKNPIVPRSSLPEIARSAGTNAVPNFDVDALSVKVPAAWLIEKAGFHKGFRLGNAGISTKHSLALVNLESASASEIIDLKDLIQTKVEDMFGIVLRPEPIFVGF